MRQFKYQRQSDPNTCGRTCLDMICRHHIHNWETEFLISLLPDTSEKTSLLSLRSAARTIGFSSDGYETSVPNLRFFFLPVILHLKSDHFVVLFSIDDQFHYIADPLCGIREWVETDFYNYWIIDGSQEGVLLTVDPRGLEEI